MDEPRDSITPFEAAVLKVCEAFAANNSLDKSDDIPTLYRKLYLEILAVRKDREKMERGLY